MRRAASLLAVAAATLFAYGPLFARNPRSGADAPELAARIGALLDDAARAAAIDPAPPIDDLALLRRVSLDVLATTPSLEEVRRLEREPELDRRRRMLERVLDDPRANDALAERLARIAVGANVKPNTLEDVLFYRRRRLVAWLSDQLAQDRPWDEIVRALVASEGIVTDTPAVNFICAAEGDPIRLAGRATRAFLGVRIDCAQCHDHPFASWKKSEFEGIAAFFARVERRGPFVRDRTFGELSVDDQMGKHRDAPPSVPLAKEALGDARTRREAFARWLTDPRNPLFAKAFVNRAWSWLMGRGLVEPADELDQVEPEKALAPLLDMLAKDFVEHRYDTKRLVRAIVLTRAYARDTRIQGDVERARAIHAAARVKQLHADQLANAIYQATNMWTYDESRNFIVRLQRFGQINDFVRRHGEDLDAERPESPTLLRRLLLMNGALVDERVARVDTPGSILRVADLAPDARAAIETVYLMILTRRPTAAELEHFEPRVDAAKEKNARRREVSDVAWALVNSTEFSWNH